MVLSKGEAYRLLELPVGADQDSIRTNYKRLALKWHPEKHGNSADAVRRFRQVSNAYRRLQTDSHSDMSLDEMLRMFQDVFFSKNLGTLNGAGYDSSDEEEDDTEDSDDDIPYPLLKMKQDLKKKSQDGGRLTTEKVNRNVDDDITEEEKEKSRAEKRKAKKKRRKERKKMEKQDQKEEKPVKKDKPAEKIKKSEKKIGQTGSSSDHDDAGFDPNSAFFTKVVNKKKKPQSGDVSSSGKREKGKDKQQAGVRSEDEVEDLDPIVLRSRQLAIRGNEMAQLGHYNPAIELFTEAINLDPRDFRFFGNRSYCFDRVHQYEKALRDAEKAISLAKDWAKGYFRKGRALAGLKSHSEAEKAFMQVLKLDKNCDDAVQELLRVRTYQLTEMGFSRQQAEASIKKHGSVQAALDSLLAGVAENSLSGEVYFSDEDEFVVAPSRSQSHHHSGPSDIKMDPHNPEGLTALWVGNVLPQVTEKKLVQMFQKYGAVTSVRLLPDKYCAFVNFKQPTAAGKAMQCLQGVECEGQRLLIKFPDNPICNGSGPAQTILKKNTTPTTTAKTQQQVQQQLQIQQQQQQQQQQGFQCRRTSKTTYKKLRA